MARGGVTFNEVDQAVRYLQGKGKNPTVDAIREYLGTGSRTTLSEHLKRWKALQADGEGRLPESLLTLVTGLWDSLQARAEERIQENQSIAHEEVTALKSQLHSALQNTETVTHECHQLQEMRDAEQRQLLALQNEQNMLLKKYEKLETANQSLVQQLEGNKEENQRLHHLAQQIQSNLEHYQKAVEQKQIQQKLESEKQLAALLQEISQLKTTLEEVTARYHHGEKTLAAKEVALQQVQESHEQLNLRYQNLIPMHEENKRVTAQLQVENNLYQKQIEKMTTESFEVKSLIQSQQTQIAVMTEQLKQAQMNLQQAENKIERLRDEKLFLVQEKSNFEGALKQLQRSNRTDLKKI